MPKPQNPQIQVAKCAEARKVRSCAECLRFSDLSVKGCPFRIQRHTPYPTRAMYGTLTADQLLSAMKSVSETSCAKIQFQPFSQREFRFLQNPSNFPFRVFLETTTKRRFIQALAIDYKSGKLVVSQLFEPTHDILRLERKELTKSVLQLCYETPKIC